jgi:hypothetical protein
LFVGTSFYKIEFYIRTTFEEVHLPELEAPGQKNQEGYPVISFSTLVVILHALK